jgi:CDGSH-type Zn-finger protein
MAEEEKPTIQPTRNGPYLVKSMKKLTNSKGEDLKSGATMLLCRCGGSNNKPFCDGTHLNIGFSGQKESDRTPDKTDNYVGENITIHDNRGVCSHRGYCTDNAPDVFRMGVEPWIDPDTQDERETIQVVKMCPSGALSYTKNGILYDKWDHEQGIMITKDGPYDVQGYVELVDPDGNAPESKDHYTLCRCGHSKNKPFCNGQHWYVNFEDPKN